MTFMKALFVEEQMWVFKSLLIKTVLVSLQENHGGCIHCVCVYLCVRLFMHLSFIYSYLIGPVTSIVS